LVSAGTDFSKPEMDHIVMAITAAEAIVRHIAAHQRLELPHVAAELFERFNPLTYRGGNRRIGGRGRPYSEPNRDQGGGKGKQAGIAHLSSPVQSAQPQHAVAQAADGQRYAGQWLRLL